MQDIDSGERLPEGLTYDEYRARWREEAGQPLDGLDRKARKYVHYKRYNLERSRRVEEGYRVGERLRRAVEAVREPQHWMVLTESWCGDSAYNLPPIAAAAALSDRIDLRILPRDAHLDVMDRYLTGGARSIPKLVAFSADGEERFTWGPRPEAARALREEMQAAGAGGPQITSALLEHYEQGGWRAVEEELAALLEAVRRRREA